MAETAPIEESRPLAWLVTTVVVGVGLYDVGVGGYLLASTTPALAHGDGTVLAALGVPRACSDAATLGTEAALRRLGAFSLHAGVVSVVWAVAGLRRPGVRSLLFATYMVTGLAFFATDQRFFSGTPYHTLKQWMGFAFTAAMVLHFAGVARRWWAGRRTPVV